MTQLGAIGWMDKRKRNSVSTTNYIQHYHKIENFIKSVTAVQQ